METSTFDVASSATRLKEAIDEGRITNDALAKLVVDRIDRVKGISEPVEVIDGAEQYDRTEKASSSWRHTWIWLV